MSFNGTHFGSGFAVGSPLGNTFFNNVTRRGVTVTWWRRTRGTKDSTSGISSETWDTSTTLPVFSITVSDNSRETPAGQIPEQRHEVHSYVQFPKNDRLEWGGHIYQVELDPEAVYFKDEAVYYRHLVMKRD